MQWYTKAKVKNTPQMVLSHTAASKTNSDSVMHASGATTHRSIPHPRTNVEERHDETSSIDPREWVRGDHREGKYLEHGVKASHQDILGIYTWLVGLCDGDQYNPVVKARSEYSENMQRTPLSIVLPETDLPSTDTRIQNFMLQLARAVSTPK